MTEKSDGYLSIQLSLFGTEVFGFRLSVDDFKTKWAIIGLAIASALTYLAIEVKGVFV